jgi:hypothetical protein
MMGENFKIHAIQHNFGTEILFSNGRQRAHAQKGIGRPFQGEQPHL